MSLWIIPTIMSVYGGIEQYNAGKDMEGIADQKRLLAEKNEMLGNKELAEEVRRQGIKDLQVAGSARARAAASGAEIDTGSPAEVLAFIETEQATELKWMKEAGASRIELRKQSEMLDADVMDMQAEQQKMKLYSSILQGLSYMGQGGLFTGAPMTSLSGQNYKNANWMSQSSSSTDLS